MRPNTIFILLSYATLSALPFLPALWGKEVEHAAWLIGIELAIWLGLWAVFGKPSVFHWLLLPAFLLVPADVFLYTYYGSGISVIHWGMLAESSSGETLEFVGRQAPLVLSALFAALGWWWLVRQSTLQAHDLDWTGHTRKAFLALTVALVGIFYYGGTFGFAPNCDENKAEPCPAEESAHGWHPLPAWLNMPFDHVRASTIRPFGLVASGMEYWKERALLSALAQRKSSFSFGARQDSSSQTPLVIVLVLGESSRHDRWSLNGYTRETNPFLKQESNLVVLSDMITSVSATRLSLPVILSRKRAIDSFRPGFAEKSLVSAFKEAGFKTYWFSNQIPYGELDSVLSAFANEAETVKFLNPGGYSNQSTIDSALLEPLSRALNEPHQKKLIILHSLGSHWNYSRRYPAGFDQWKPSLFEIKAPSFSDKTLKAEINNSYDNSILYTDWFLSRVIAALKSTRESSAMVYLSDHGENLYDGNCDFMLHGYNTTHDFHLPAFSWYSDAYASANQTRITRLHANKDARLSTENIFPSLLDMAGIRFRGEQLDRSVFSDSFTMHKRYVDSYGWADYDNSKTVGVCQELRDKGKPLQRSARPF